MASQPRHDWFLESWMLATGLDQTALRKATGWSRRKASDLCTGEQRYNRDTLNEAAHAMHIAPYELLIHPADANEIKSLRAAVRHEAARLIAAEDRQEYKSGPREAERTDFGAFPKAINGD